MRDPARPASDPADPDREAILERRRRLIERSLTAAGVLASALASGCGEGAPSPVDAAPREDARVDAPGDAPGDALGGEVAGPVACLCACATPVRGEPGAWIAGLVVAGALATRERKRST